MQDQKDACSDFAAAPISSLRRQIDGLDDELLALINRRMVLAAEIGALKRKAGSRVLDTSREANVLRRLEKRNRGPLSRRELQRLFTEIMQLCRGVQGSAADGRREPDAGSCLYAVLGNPVRHSLSPQMHNRAFAHCGINAVYMAFCVTRIDKALDAARSLGIKGLSVTLPHKTAALSCMDRIDESAARVGALNTVVLRAGQLVGYNTDGTGAMRALQAAVAVEGRRAALIGAGGAARAIGYALTDAGAAVTIVNRSVSRGRGLARELGAQFCPRERFDGSGCQILINTTPVGMHPHEDAMPVDIRQLAPETVVMDIIYNPLKTALIRAAESRGCRTVSGLEMFVAQGAAQFELWTRQPAPEEIMRQAVVEALPAPESEERI